jgi:hypothetical protein
MEVEAKQRWEYTLPDGSKVTNMKDAKIKLGVSKTRLIGMLKSGVVKRVEIIDAEPLTGYEHTTGTINQNSI